MKSKKQGFRAPIAQFIAIIALSISIFLVVDLGRRAAANYRVQREAERLSQEVEQARLEQQALKTQLGYVQSDLFVEDMARQDLKWARPGETVVVVLATPEVVAQSPQATHKTVIVGPVAQTPAQAWWLLFFGPYAAPRYTRDASP